MTTTIYACYGVFGHEKEVFYWTYPIDICDKITVEIPESLFPYETKWGEIAVLMPIPNTNMRTEYLLHELLVRTKDGEPALIAYGKTYKLKRVNNREG